MRQASPELKNLARRLLAHEAKKSPSPVKLAEALAVCCQRLHTGLDPLIGGGGFRALLDRALYLAKKEHSWLNGVGIEDYPGCELKTLREAMNGKEPAVINETFTVILANVIWLLVTFIGEDIALGLIEEAWPDMKIATASISKEGQ
ncbi:MAG TPA: hypothetical protein VKA97_00675 [Pyrinomonadaceae bacterium]|nr:hypothetical protein [Pyrinomonadaceae bacterium]